MHRHGSSLRRISFHILIPLVLIFLSGADSFAGVFELAGQANYRKTNYDSTHSEEEETGTVSLAYYFWDMSALEVSYTRGAADQLDPQYTAFQQISAYGVDIMFTLAEHDSAFKPYVKVGAAWVDKNLQYYISPLTYGIETSGVAPTAGVGFKYMLGQQFGLKFGIDASSSPLFFYSETLNPTVANPPAQPVTYDVSAAAGISFLF